MRLIDADAIPWDVEGVGEIPVITKEEIDQLPTIEVPTVGESVGSLPVRHGKWMVTPVYIKCSECGESFMLIPQNYCPHCGARMDEE